MLDENDLLLDICSNTSFTLAGSEDGILTWKCRKCGQLVDDNLSTSATVVFGPHYKPGREPKPKQQEFLGETYVSQVDRENANSVTQPLNAQMERATD